MKASDAEKEARYGEGINQKGCSLVHEGRGSGQHRQGRQHRGFQQPRLEAEAILRQGVTA
jgi:hypothetical protein